MGRRIIIEQHESARRLWQSIGVESIEQAFSRQTGIVEERAGTMADNLAIA
ncbi:hypothetical protein NKJ26_33090 [Mesorhizobium sp. M0152]|uniref:hypothetical protein n=1 Tax=Mesorhizobium sp. M0152 TaxID=2956898 RepID=UPI003339D013